MLKHNPGLCLIETCVPLVRIQTAFQVLEWFFPGDMAAWTCHMSGNTNVFVRKNVAKKAPNRSFADETNFYIFVQRVPDCCPPGLGLALGLSSRKDALCHLPALHGFDTMLCPALEVGGLQGNGAATPSRNPVLRMAESSPNEHFFVEGPALIS